MTYRVDAAVPPLRSASAPSQWLKAWPGNGATNSIELSSRVVVQLGSAADVGEVISGASLRLSRAVGRSIFILQAPDALSAADQAQRLAGLPNVLAAYPVFRRQASLDGSYAPGPTDNLFPNQWELEHRSSDGSPAGVDLDVRAAWPYAKGKGVTIAVVDTGVELTHPELSARVAGAPQFNFTQNNTNAGPFAGTATAAHGTEVAGLAAASINNARMVGVAPEASLSSFVVFDTNFHLATDEELMDAYQYQSNVVDVENLSWGNNGYGQEGPSLLEQVGISNAVHLGRGGRGIVMVRSAGNERALGANADDDHYPSDPQVIAVAAVRKDGRVASSSEPGACILVGAPSGDSSSGFDGLITTDLLGSNGVNQLSFYPPDEDLSGYVFGSTGFSGTSAAAAEISGVAALILSANPNLSYRDVQQILILSSRQFDLGDPDLVTNGAGFLVSHNVGFGVPDAGVAVNLARTWKNRPALTNVTVVATNVAAIPDDGLRLLITGSGVPASITSIHTLPSVGPHADTPTPWLSLADFGFGTNLAGFDLANRGALIQRGGTDFASAIDLAARAGAAFAVVYNYATNSSGVGAPGGSQLMPMGGTDFVPIPAVFIAHQDGEALKQLFATNRTALAQIHLTTTHYVLTVTNTLLCEHVGLRVMTDHPLRGDIRITLVSPSGTRSVLQRYNGDETPGPIDWTYYTTHDFFESSAGDWTVYFSDEYAGATGSVHFVSLTIYGVPILDTDRDGLDDNWELAHFGNLRQGPMDDPDHDGYSNAREQLMGTDPTVANNFPFSIDLSRWNNTINRLSWPASPAWDYEIWSGADPASLNLTTNLPGRFPELEWFTPRQSSRQFFQVRAISPP